MALQTGEKAPLFSLYNTDKELVSLADYQGKNVLILFFPLAFTNVCTAELCSIRDGLAEYQGLNTEILAISVDSPQTLKQYKISQEYNFSLLSDFNKEVSTAYGSIYELFSLGMRGVSKRSAFVIDQYGVIQYAEVLENAGEVPNFVAIKKILSNLNQ
ncbi:MAG: redoxin domain-containing protein [Saprospiraceae bacterium]|nr:redoxin domain-containing protein [Saprospiraceae bacterium]